jgi:branched-chain amino acid transport system ATP-binding protein
MSDAGRGEPLLEVSEVTKRFGGVTAVSNCSIALRAGGIYGLIGPNGSGKTTLFNCITGLEQRDAGTVTLGGRRIDGLAPHRVARLGVGRTFQVIRVFPELTALENLLVVARGDRTAALARAAELLALVRLERLAGEFAGNLSYGQQKLVEFARVLMMDPFLILLDEPAAGVNRTLLNGVLAVIRRLHAEGRTILIVEHDMQVVMGLCDYLFVLDHGQKIAEGVPETIRADARVIEAYFGRPRGSH